MRRSSQLSFLLLAACLCLPAVGCGGDAATTDTPASSEAGDESATAVEEGSAAVADAEVSEDSDAKE